MKYIIVAIAFVASFGAEAARMSKIIGNGGDVLVCEDRTPRVQLLDFAESRILREKNIQLTEPPGATYVEKLEWIRERIVHRFPQLGRTLANEIFYFENANVKLDDLELEDIQDSFHRFHLSGCTVHQIANQSAPLVDDDPAFIISNQLWTQLFEFDKAGLVLHEVLYRMGLRYGLEHSVGVRYLVSLFFDDNLLTVSDRQWIQAFQLSRIKYYELNGVRFPVFSGDADTCVIPPGALSCENLPEIKPAVFSYENGASIRSVQYPDGPETLEYKMKDGFVIDLISEHFQFEFGMEGFRIKTNGLLTVYSRFSRTGISKAEMKIKGEVNITNETYCGPIVFLDLNGKEMPARTYCGDMDDLVDIYSAAVKAMSKNDN